MLYVIYGSDVIGVRKRAHECVTTCVKDTGNNDIHTLTESNFSKEALENLAGAISLFTPSEVVLLDTLSGSDEAFATLLELIPLLAESTNTFVVIEGVLKAPEKKLCTKYAKELTELNSKAIEKFNAFTLTDALLRRDKKSLWILLIEAWRNGLSNEEIIGILFWQVKMLRLVSKTKSAEEVGQKPFVYDKAKRALHQFKPDELTHFSRDLVRIYHDGHMGKRNSSIALEEWVLRL